MARAIASCSPGGNLRAASMACSSSLVIWVR
jgi:hypothetical protein